MLRPNSLVMIENVGCQISIRPSTIARLLGGNNLGIFYYAWVIPGIALVFFLGCYFYSFLLRLPTKTRLRFLISAILYLGGCIGFELIGGKYTELYGDQSLTYALITTVEESLEMSGLIVFIWELRVRFDFTPDQSNQNMNNGVLSTVRQQD
jgi:hypothetical protein